MGWKPILFPTPFNKRREIDTEHYNGYFVAVTRSSVSWQRLG